MEIFEDPYFLQDGLDLAKKPFHATVPLRTGEATQREERLERGRRGSRYGYVS
jgi:hypothetical protein